MDGGGFSSSSDSSFDQRAAQSLGWKTRPARAPCSARDDSPHDNKSVRSLSASARDDSPHDNKSVRSRSSSASRARHLDNMTSERRQGDSRRTTRRSQEEIRDRGGATADITAIIDNYFFFNAAHAAAANKVGGVRLFGGQDKDYLRDGANEINAYKDNEELESKFVRTLEWVGETSKVISPTSSISRDSLSSRLMRTSSNKNADIVSGANDSKVMRAINEISQVDEIKGTMSLGDKTKEVFTTEIRRDMDVSISKKVFEGETFRLPPSAISRKEVHATSFRAPKTEPSHVSTKSSAFNGDIRAAVTMDGGPSATCRLPCQSCGNGPSKKVDTVCGHDQNDYGHINIGDRFYGKPNYAMGHYDRNDRLAKSAYHNPHRKAQTCGDENLVVARNPTSAIGKGIKEEAPRKEVTTIKSRGQGEKPQVPEKTLKDAVLAKASHAARVQQWFSKFIGKRDDSPKSPKATKDLPTRKPPLSTDYELVSHLPTMESVLTNKLAIAPKPRYDNQPPQLGHTVNCKRRSVSAHSRGPSLAASMSAPGPSIQNDPRGSSRRFVADAQMQRFGYGSRSERWAPLHVRKEQDRQPRDSYQENKQRLMQVPTKYNNSKSARSSPSKEVQSQQRPGMDTLVASSRYENAKMGNENAASVVNQERSYQKQNRDERCERNPARVRPSQENIQELMSMSSCKHYVQDNVQNERQEGNTMTSDQHNPRASHVSKLERFSQRHHVSRDSDEGFRRSFDKRNYDAHVSKSERFSQGHHVSRDSDEGSGRPFDKRNFDSQSLTNKKIHPMKGIPKAHEIMTSIQALPPPATNEDKDIEVLNSFLLSKRENLQRCSTESRLHFILSNTSVSSMIAAMCYAWVLHNSKISKVESWERVPVLNIPRNDMWKYKQLAWLFDQAGLDSHALLFSNEVDMDVLADLVGEYRISKVGQDIIRLRKEVASFCTIVAEALFKEVEMSMQAKCIRILLLAGLLIDTENFDSSNAPFTKRDEVAARSLLPGAGHKGRSVLLAELKQEHNTEGFYSMMGKNYGEQSSNGVISTYEDACNYLRKKSLKAEGILPHIVNKEDPNPSILPTTAGHFQTTFFEEYASSFARSKSSKSHTSASTTSTDHGKSRSSSTSPPFIIRSSSKTMLQMQLQSNEELSP